MIGLGTLLNVGDLTADNARDQQLAHLRNALSSARVRTGGATPARSGQPASGPNYENGEILPEDKLRRLYDSASTPEEKKMKDTANEFVSILYGMMFKEMDNAVQRTGFLDGGHTEETFRSMVLDDYAKTAASQGSNPMAQRIYEMLYAANSKRVDSGAGAPAAAHERIAHGLASPRSGNDPR